MENASKALLIAGGVLIIIILASLILLVKANISNFYASQDELQMSTDKAKFNEEFTRFNRNDVAGYELISLANKVIDYNERISTETSSGSGNDVQADPVKIVITLWDGSAITRDTVKLKLSNDGNLRLFNSKGLIADSKGDATALNKDKYSNDKSELKKVLDETTGIEQSCPKISILTKKIDSIILKNLNKGLKNGIWDSVTLEPEEKEKDRKDMLVALSSYRSAVGDQNAYKLTDEKYETVANQYKNMLNNNADNMYKYYEFTQFKKAKFKCTKLNYKEETGKVDEIDFLFTGEIE